jgi:UTP--glucose-1-phosphate uridylyltransferase
MSPRTVRKALIPAAGRGTRFLPVTKSVPKELAPLVTTPALEFVVAEAAEHGISDVVLVTSADKAAVAEYFSPNEELEAALEKKDDPKGLESIRRAPALATVHEVHQDEPLGLGHAVGCGEQLIGGEPFAVLLPDDLIDDRDHLLGTMIETFAAHGGIVIGLIDVGRENISRYGSVALAPDDDPSPEVVTITDLIEKPPADEAPSTLAIIGRYILPPEIFDALRQTGRGAGGEIQLTDAMKRLAHDGTPVHGVIFRGRRYDTGDPLEYSKAFVQLAERHPEIGPEFTAWLREYVREYVPRG